MKAGELYKKLTANPFHGEYKGIYTQISGSLVPLTAAKADDEGNLIFFYQRRKSPIIMRTLFAILLLHENKTLYYWNSSKIEIYGYRVEHGKIIV
ncbi:hypothetical protein I588_05215 [Enterococcus pallens ATCC BAA-351]|uniref:Uncharacterized protein n=1 Tax=Enterococcus pallens ATCC BAA-351 TaxID=1158607 RepID=R2PP43_9ENTE|nr:hypothetical protein UAU_05219 [Enterococcus pallens ATCC BAA-351]EOU09482.1 hypothetical protein I588_05215 [Enterococcus pallens ATCC BAA-351]